MKSNKRILAISLLIGQMYISASDSGKSSGTKAGPGEDISKTDR